MKNPVETGEVSTGQEAHHLLDIQNYRHNRHESPVELRGSASCAQATLLRRLTQIGLPLPRVSLPDLIDDEDADDCRYHDQQESSGNQERRNRPWCPSLK
jgi:hypothetical protein